MDHVHACVGKAAQQFYSGGNRPPQKRQKRTEFGVLSSQKVADVLRKVCVVQMLFLNNHLCWRV